MQRIVALGASNLTRGLATVVNVAVETWGSDVEVIAALGHGRSYGMRSRVLIRELPGILESELWDALARTADPVVLGLITDVGNDVLYDVPPQRILEWVDMCAARLQDAGAPLVMTGLPLASIARLGPARFTVFRSVFVPSCRLSLHEVRARARDVHDGLARIAATRGATFAELPGEWYGIDPIHVRPGRWDEAWRAILQPDARSYTRHRPSPQPLAWGRLYAAAPARQWICGVERRHPQPAVTRGDTRVALY